MGLLKRSILLLFALALVTTAIGTSVLLKSDNDIDMGDPNLFSSLGNFLFNEGMTGHAVVAFEKSLELDDYNAVTLNNLGVSLLQTDKEKAMRHFKEALNIDPNYEMARKNLAVLQTQIGKYEEAINNFRTLVEEYPDNVQYNYDLAVNLGNKFYHNSRDENDLEEALKIYYKVKEVSPKYEHLEENIKVLEEVKQILES